MEADDNEFLEILREDCSQLLKESAYNVVDLASLFNFNPE